MKFLFLGIPGMTIYEGYDLNRRPIACKAGEWVEVSPEKGERLMADFPGSWRKENEAEAKEEPPPKHEEIEAGPEAKPAGRKKHGR